MRIKVTDDGVLIPRHLLPDVEEVEIRADGDNVIVFPAGADDDPILGLGSAPVDCGVSDASEAHDRYIYSGDERFPEQTG